MKKPYRFLKQSECLLQTKNKKDYQLVFITNSNLNKLRFSTENGKRIIKSKTIKKGKNCS